jgi:siderophore synthetase component
MRPDEDPTGARAAILGRLWGALYREPIDGVTARRIEAGTLILTLHDGRDARGPGSVAAAFARHRPGLAITIGDHTVTSAVELLDAAVPASPRRDRLRAELDNSTLNLARARARAATGTVLPLLDLIGTAGSLAYLEQSVVDGHPLHPLCRARTGMSGDDIMRYAPEFRPTIDLPIVAVPPERWLSTGTGLPPRLPMHPWQRDHVLADHPQLRDTGRRIRARPLMSLRTVALVADPGWHLKTSVDIQMTSAVRTVSPAAIHNGPAVSRLLTMLTDNEPLEILAEVAAGAVLVDGAACRSLAVIRRRAPRTAADEITMPFAVLSARSPATGRAIVTEAIGGDPEVFFDRLMRLALPPLLRLLRVGVALEAHGQNLLVTFQGRSMTPVRLVYRDMGGVRISPRLLLAAGIEAPPLQGDLASDDPDELRTKFAAAFLSTVVAEL